MNIKFPWEPFHTTVPFTEELYCLIRTIKCSLCTLSAVHQRITEVDTLIYKGSKYMIKLSDVIKKQDLLKVAQNIFAQNHHHLLMSYYLPKEIASPCLFTFTPYICSHDVFCHANSHLEYENNMINPLINPLYINAYSLYCSPYISYRTRKENLSKYQDILSSVITFFILIT